ncbi:MAG: septum formation initiator family protein [Oscillospiraceae bacterium]|nr:septum formation initiator family protein [Oscillospiraceae bacterium]
MNSIFKKIRLRSLLFALAILYLSISLITAQFELMTKRQEYETVAEQRQRIEIEVQETRSLLEEGEDAVYIERIARERLGYANPGEKIYVDVQSE